MRYLFLMLLSALVPLVITAPVPDYLQGQRAHTMQAGDAAEDDEEDEEPSGLPQAELALDVGRYKAAIVEFRKVLKDEPEHQGAGRGLAEAYNQTGDYRLAIRALDRIKEPEPETLSALGRLYLLTGDYTKADSTAELLKATKTVTGGIEGHLLAGNVLRLQGKYEEANVAFDAVRQVVLAARGNVMRIERDKGPQPALADLWCSAGEAYFWMNRLPEANDCLNNAAGDPNLHADENHLRSNAWLSRLFLETNKDSSVQVNYAGRVLRRNPNAAELRMWLAGAHFYRWRSGAGMEQLEEALKLNPNHPDILSMRALRYLYSDQYDAARTDYERALKTNPHHTDALGAKALHAAMLDMKDQLAEAESAMLAINPKPARFYEVMADGLSDRFRYVEAFPLYDKALKANPAHWTAYKGYGMASMNNGDDVTGKKMLEVALDKDPLRNNLQTLNLLTLLDSYKNFERIETEDGRWRLLVHKSEAPVMRDLYIEHLNASWDHMVKKYNFTPRTPITVEAFHRHEDFEVRTVGITGLPALGACFGQLITLDSPGARPPGSYNWASTLRHEMDHVFQIQISNGQVPRWLAEGLSVYEEKTTRPEWERHMHDQLFMHYHMDDLPPIKKFNEWFRDGSKVLFAYYLGNVMLEFIDKKLGGMGAVREMLERFGKKETPEEVFRATLKLEPEEFDRRFAEYVRDERIAHLRMVKRISADRVEKLYFKYEDGEISDYELVELALGYIQQGSRFDADTFLGMARKRGADKVKGPEGAIYWYCQYLLANANENLTREQRTTNGREALRQAIGCGLEDFNTFLQLAQMAQQDRDTEMTLHWLKEANRAFPENPQPYAYMYQLYQQSGQAALAIEAAEKWMQYDENNLQIRLWLIETVYASSRNWSKMAIMAEQALNVAPMDPRCHQFYAFALRRLERWDEAVKHYEFVRRLASGTPDEALSMEANAWLDIAATWLQAEQADKCRAALDKAKALQPNNPRIKTIEEELEADATEEEDDF